MEELWSRAGIPSLVPVLKDRWSHISRAAPLWGEVRRAEGSPRTPNTRACVRAPSYLGSLSPEG